MKFLKIDQWESLDEVKTEETISRLMIEDKRCKNLDFEYCYFNWADAINKKGLPFAQTHIDRFRTMSSNTKRLIFVCQHISVDRLDWGDSIVFTPHATNEDSFYSIPHFAINTGNLKPIGARSLKGSFLGSYETHQCRGSLAVTVGKRNDCFMGDTGKWHFHNENRDANQKQYVEILSDTKVCFCPRGTGPSTIRLWEAMATGCIPLLITDSLKLPLDDEIDWDDLMVRIQPHLTPLVDSALDLLNDNDLQKMSNRVTDTYNKYFCNEKLHMTIIKTLERYGNRD